MLMTLNDAAQALARGAAIDWPELEAETLTCGRLEQQIRRAAPAVIVVNGQEVLAVEKVRGNRAILLTEEGGRVRMPLEKLRELLTAAAAAPHRKAIGAMLDECGIGGPRRARACEALLRERLFETPVGELWQVRAHPGSSFAQQMRQTGLMKRLAGLALAHLLDYGLWMLSWVVIGQAALSGRVDSGELLAWVLLLATLIPVRLWVTWSQGVLAVGVGGLLKQRLLAGVLSLDADALRAEGAGRMLGRTIEAEALESMALSGGLAAFLAIVELFAAAAVLAYGAGGWAHTALLGLWVGLTFGLGALYARRRARWTDSRLSMTHDLVERMAGHRTRLAQEQPDDWHTGEDEAMASYANDSARLDRMATILQAALPRGWVLAAVAVLAPWWIGAPAGSAGAIAVAVGGILLAAQSLRRLTAGLGQLAGAGIAWRQVAPLFRSAARHPISSPASRTSGDTILEAADLVFRYRHEGTPVLRGCSLKVRRGDFLLLEGGSGSGKSTLASLIAGLRKPESGMLLAGGLDLHSLGESGWRKRVAAAPQYHENHVLSASFAFNLLMGRQWPPTRSDLKEAEAICREMGLGPLIDRMPGGLMQMVGETGWQLSQGERSRLFMARALLQGGDLVVLDESFAALDPQNLRQALECVVRRAETLLVVAHP
jgi:ATP-binding cassette subfamily B protein